MRPSSAALLGLLALAALFSLLYLFQSEPIEAAWNDKHHMVGQYGLTDLALFTEARYTRHPSQADIHAALQDHPGAFEHFPSGALITPAHLPVYQHAKLAGKTTSPD